MLLIFHSQSDGNKKANSVGLVGGTRSWESFFVVGSVGVVCKFVSWECKYVSSGEGLNGGIDPEDREQPPK